MAKKIWNPGDQLNAADLNGNFMFGGTGADGAISISSGTTTIAVAAALYVAKNYTTISITGTAVLTISGQPTNGTILVLRSQGNCTLTSTATPAINLAGLGATGATSGVATDYTYSPAGGGGASGNGASQAAGGVGGQTGNGGDIATAIYAGKHVPLRVGGGGGNGGGNYSSSIVPGGGGGAGGEAVLLANAISANTGTFVIAGGYGAPSSSSSTRSGGSGGGCVYIEVGLSLNFTCQISVAGSNAGTGTGGAGGNGLTGGTGMGGNGGPGDAGGFAGGAGAGGGSGFSCANGSYNGAGGGGASGSYFVGTNSVFS